MTNIKNYFRPILSLASLVVNTLYDLRRYFAQSASNAKEMTDNQLRARLFQKAHSIEKGLALPSVRFGFGIAPLIELKNLLKTYRYRNLSEKDIAFLSAKNVITAYINYHEHHGMKIPNEVDFIYDLSLEDHDSNIGGVTHLKSEDIIKESKENFERLVNARHSTRMFSDAEPNIELIKKSISMARLSPSVCNRQGGRVSIINNKSLIDKVLQIQGGTRGFTDEIPVVLVVSCYLGLFRGARERNQCWIDGGLFSMTLLYALSFYGLATCPLNWSSDYKQDIALRDTLEIPNDQAVIMLIAVGNLREEYKVASSARSDDNDFILRIYS